MAFRIYTYEDPYKLNQTDFWPGICAIPNFCVARGLLFFLSAAMFMTSVYEFRCVYYNTLPPHMQQEKSSFYAKIAGQSPLKAEKAGPVINALSPSCHSIVRSPPGRCTSTGLAHSPLHIAATAQAVAPVPQAIVSPLPLSQTRMRISCSPSTCANSIFALSGKSGCLSSKGPDL